MPKPVANQKFSLSATASTDSTRQGVLIGRASTSSMNSYGFNIAPLAFLDSITNAPSDGPDCIKFLLHHNETKPFGKILSLQYDTDNSTLLIEVQLFLDIEDANNFYIAAKNLGGLSFSVGFEVTDTTSQTIDGKEVYTITKGELHEVSGVTFPADPNARMTEVLSKDPIDLQKLSDFERWLVDSGTCPTRKKAEQLSRLIKRNLSLFEKREPALAAASEDEQPWLADETAMTLLSASASLLNVTANAAKQAAQELK